MKKFTAKPILALALATTVTLPNLAVACGTDDYLGTICAFGFNFCPRGTLPANGQLLSISQNTALFSLIGTIYGGDGRTTFALPDLRGRTMVNAGQGPGLSNVVLGQQGGSQQVTLTVNQMPSHDHTATTTVTASAVANAVAAGGNNTNPSNNKWASSSSRDNVYSSNAASASMSPEAISVSANATTTVNTAGGGQPVNIQSPYLGITYCIVTQGIFPSRN